MKIFVLLLAGMLTACATEPKLNTADIQYYSKHEPVSSKTSVALAKLTDTEATTCIRVIDNRTRTATQGWDFPRPQVKDWLIEGLESRLGVTVVFSANDDPLPPYLALETLYIKHIATTMAGVTVLRAYGETESLAFRGNMTRLNWNGTNREYSRVLSQSLDAAIAKLPLPAIIQTDCPSEETAAVKPSAASSAISW